VTRREGKETGFARRGSYLSDRRETFYQRGSPSRRGKETLFGTLRRKKKYHVSGGRTERNSNIVKERGKGSETAARTEGKSARLLENA